MSHLFARPDNVRLTSCPGTVWFAQGWAGCHSSLKQENSPAQKVHAFVEISLDLLKEKASFLLRSGGREMGGSGIEEEEKATEKEGAGMSVSKKIKKERKGVYTTKCSASKEGEVGLSTSLK